MDIAALLAVGSMPPAPGVPAGTTSEAVPMAGTFSDLLVAAMATPATDVPAGADPVAMILPTLVAPGAVDSPMTALPKLPSVAAVDPVPTTNSGVAPEETGPLSAIATPQKPAIAETPAPPEPPNPAPRPSDGKRKAEPTTRTAPSPPPKGGPPDTPPVATEASRKEANAEAPNAPAKEQDRPEAKAPVAVVELTAVAPVPAPASSGVPISEPEASVRPVASPSAKPTVKPLSSDPGTQTEPESAPIASKGDLTVDEQSPVTAPSAPAPSELQPETTGKNPTPTGAFIATKEGKASPSEGPKLPSAPDLGIVPQVTVAPVPTEEATEPSRPTDRSVTKKTRDEAQLAPTTLGENSPKAEVPVGAKTAAVAVGSGDSTPEDTPAGGEDAPHEGPDPQPSSAPFAVRTAATEKPEAGAQRPEIDRHLVVRQVADRIENLVAARPREGVTIHLEPRDLGSVTLVVKGLASALDVQMTASDPRVRESLDGSRPELAQALAPRGIELRDLRVASAPSNASGTSGRDAGPNSDGRPRQQSPRSSTPSFANPTGRSTPSQPRPRASRSGRGVDLLV